MRWLFLLLLILNLFYYIWHQQQTPLKIKEIPSLSLYQGAKQDIRLLGEAGAAKVPRAQEGQDIVTGIADVCLFLGGFEREDLAREVEQRLISLDVQPNLQSVDAPAGLDFWVYLPPLASRDASLRQLRELQARKIDSYIITQGDLSNGISLGIFPRSESAESVVQRLREAGYEPLMRELPRAHRSYWVRVAPGSRTLINDEMLQVLAADFSGLQHQLMPCESVATPR
ncbi:SPOR domain-containing protein [Pseudomonas sp. LS44]|uniref:SPOR domain-containing protein n=1 Tax=Pseudomonas sp. LS44 TaxID=1357074 RepID=UPI00215AA891|nr:SPOR domain-containing protein [Pseudomonas sp. LS44]UVE17359.1 SPOR domain-containing protein [Pseudomonas sp. LS44]